MPATLYKRLNPTTHQWEWSSNNNGRVMFYPNQQALQQAGFTSTDMNAATVVPYKPANPHPTTPAGATVTRTTTPSGTVVNTPVAPADVRTVVNTPPTTPAGTTTPPNTNAAGYNGNTNAPSFGDGINYNGLPSARISGYTAPMNQAAYMAAHPGSTPAEWQAYWSAAQHTTAPNGAQSVLSPPPGAHDFRDGQWYDANGKPVSGNGGPLDPSGSQNVNSPPPGAAHFLNGQWYDASGQPVADQLHNSFSEMMGGATGKPLGANATQNQRILGGIYGLGVQGQAGSNIYQQLGGTTDQNTTASNVLGLNANFNPNTMIASRLQMGMTPQQVYNELNGQAGFQNGEASLDVINQTQQAMQSAGVPMTAAGDDTDWEKEMLAGNPHDTTLSPAMHAAIAAQSAQQKANHSGSWANQNGVPRSDATFGPINNPQPPGGGGPTTPPTTTPPPVDPNTDAWVNQVRATAAAGQQYNPNGANSWAIGHSDPSVLNTAFGAALVPKPGTPPSTPTTPLSNASPTTPTWGAQTPIQPPVGQMFPN